MHKLFCGQDVHSHVLYTEMNQPITLICEHLYVYWYSCHSQYFGHDSWRVFLFWKSQLWGWYCFTNILLVMCHLVKCAPWVPASIWLPKTQRTIARIFGQLWLNADCRIVLLDHIILSNVSSVVAYYFLMMIICISEPFCPWCFTTNSLRIHLCLQCASLWFERRPVASGPLYPAILISCKGWVGRTPCPTPKTIQLKVNRRGCAKQKANISMLAEKQFLKGML